MAWNPHRYLIAAARKVWRWSPERKQIANACESERGTKRKCAKCNGVYPRKQVQIDHIKPVGTRPMNWDDYPKFYARLFCTADKLQPLCLKCHTAKTTQDNRLTKWEKEHGKAKRLENKR